MNLVFSSEQEALRQEFARLLDAETGYDRACRILQDRAWDADLWASLAGLGWTGAGIPERCGGAGLEASTLCVLAEEFGRRCAAVPFGSCVLRYMPALRLLDNARDDWLAGVAAGSAIGTLADPYCWTNGTPTLAKNTLGGQASAIVDGMAADVALIAYIDGAASWIAHVDLRQSGVQRQQRPGLDMLHPLADIRFDGARTEVLARGEAAAAAWQRIVDHCAVFLAFEQLGGAEAALHMAHRHVQERQVFGRTLGSFQAVKHTLADMLVAIELARANACHAAAALAEDDGRLAEAAAVAMLSAGDAYRLCARGSLQLHGAMGATWEAPCHVHYRRSQVLPGLLAPRRQWEQRLAGMLFPQAGAAAEDRHASA